MQAMLQTKQLTDCQYIGQTGRTLRERFGEYRRDITSNQHEKSGVAEHFNGPTTHSLTSLSSHSKPYVIDEHQNNNLSLKPILSDQTV